MKFLRFIVVGFAVLLLGACAEEGYVPIPSQSWKGVVVRIESRPTQVVSGMNEFLVILNDERGRYVHDAIVSLRADDSQKWQQAIQDGFTGVYRRAVLVRDPKTQQLQVQIKRNDDEGVLRFVLVAGAAGSSATN